MKAIRKSLFIAAVCGAFLISCGTQYRDQNVPIKTVAEFDLERYLGRWYEIERFPNRFEEDCVATTADYSLNDNGTVKVLNTCRLGTIDGPVDDIEGTATVVGVGMLDVGFVQALPFATGDYWILGLRGDYSVAVVGNQRGTTGWILARGPQIEQTEIDWARGVLADNGYDISQLMAVPQIVPK